jgi:hypothetical protein
VHGVGFLAVPAAEEIKVAAFVRLENVVQVHPAIPVRVVGSRLPITLESAAEIEEVAQGKLPAWKKV